MLCVTYRFDSCTQCHLFDFSVISAPSAVWLSFFQSRGCLDACCQPEWKQNKTRQIKIKILSKSDFPSAWFSCQLSFSMNTLLHLRPWTHTRTYTYTQAYTCTHIWQCKCVSAWLHRCHQFYLTSAPFRITRFNVSLKCVNELTIWGSQSPISPTQTHTHTHLCTEHMWGHKLWTIHINNDRP